MRRSISRSSGCHMLLVAVLSTLLVASLLYVMYTAAVCGSRAVERFATEADPRLTIFVFLMEGCGWCDKFKPELSKLTSKLSSDSTVGDRFELRVIRFPTQSAADRQLMKDFSVEGFPTIVLATSDQAKFWVYYANEERTAEKVLEWAQKQAASMKA